MVVLINDYLKFQFNSSTTKNKQNSIWYGFLIQKDLNSIIRPIPSIVPRWCSSRRDLKTGNSKDQETTAPPVIEASKSLLSIAPLDARYINIFIILY